MLIDVHADVEGGRSPIRTKAEPPRTRAETYSPGRTLI